MSRNGYTNEVHTEERTLIELQQVQMERLSSALQNEANGAEMPLLPMINPKKMQRSKRRDQARKHKPARYRNAGTQSF